MATGIRRYAAHRYDPLKGDPHVPEQVKSRFSIWFNSKAVKNESRGALAAARAVPLDAAHQLRIMKPLIGRTPEAAVTLEERLKPYDILLGKVSETVIAEMAGTTTGKVVARRKRLGISSHLELYDHLLGTMPDQALADLARVKKQTITTRRTTKGVESFRDQEQRRLSKFDYLLGVLDDPAVGKLTNRSKGAMLKRRRKQNILAAQPRCDSPPGAVSIPRETKAR